MLLNLNQLLVHILEDPFESSLEDIKDLLNRGANPNYSDGCELPLFLVLDEGCWPEAAQLLLEYGANPNIWPMSLPPNDESYYPPIVWAAGPLIDRDLAIGLVKDFLRHGAETNFNYKWIYRNNQEITTTFNAWLQIHLPEIFNKFEFNKNYNN